MLASTLTWHGDCADWIIAEKPAPLLIHPTRPDNEQTLWHLLQNRFPDESLCLINRLDRETSGLVLVSKNSETSSVLGKMSMNRLIRKRYLALVKGCPPEQGIIDQPIGRKSDFETSEIYVLQIIHPNGKLAKTKFQRLETRIFRDHPVSLIEIELLTGRMHQIRVHFQHIGYPVIGDKLYGPDTKFYLQVVESGWHPSMIDQLYIRRQALHASYLEFEWQGKIVSFNSPLPDDLQKFWDSCTPA